MTDGFSRPARVGTPTGSGGFSKGSAHHRYGLTIEVVPCCEKRGYDVGGQRDAVVNAKFCDGLSEGWAKHGSVTVRTGPVSVLRGENRVSQRYHSFVSEDGTTILVRTVEPSLGEAGAEHIVGWGSDKMEEAASDAVAALDSTIAAIGRAASRVAQNLRAELPSDCDEVSITLHANIAGKASVKIFEVSADAGIEIQLTWKNE